MNKPNPMREGFVVDDTDNGPFERDVGRPARIPPPHEPDIEAQKSKPEAKPEVEQAAAAIQAITWPFIYTLRYRPLKVSASLTINELTFREPSAGDILEFGNPVNVEITPLGGKQVSFGVKIDDNRMISLLGNLCTDKRILSQHLGGLDVRDYANIANKLRRFFRPDWEMLNY
jgi:Phage tail assembly chaperone proteins, E, or 41 or 14